VSPPAPAARILRGYGPLLAFAVLFCLMATFVPTVGDEVRTVPAEAVPGGEGAPGGFPAGDGPGAGEESTSLPSPGSPGVGPSGAPRHGTSAKGSGGGTAAGPGQHAA
jgi:hypothetical protein